MLIIILNLSFTFFINFSFYKCRGLISNPCIGKKVCWGHTWKRKLYVSLFDDIDSRVSELFTNTIDAFNESDATKASLAWKYERKIVKECDKIVENLTKSEFSVNEAVCFTLIARYFKRLSAHLANIATSVILPLSDLDYYDEQRRDDIGEIEDI